MAAASAKKRRITNFFLKPVDDTATDKNNNDEAQLLYKNSLPTTSLNVAMNLIALLFT